MYRGPHLQHIFCEKLISYVKSFVWLATHYYILDSLPIIYNRHENDNNDNNLGVLNWLVNLLYIFNEIYCIQIYFDIL